LMSAATNFAPDLPLIASNCLYTKKLKTKTVITVWPGNTN